MAAIGIDLGTTNSCAAVYRNNSVEIIMNRLGDRLTPSYVGFEKAVSVGKVPKQRAELGNQKNIVYQIKRLIGRNFDEEVVQNDMKLWGFEVVEKDNKPMYKVEHKKGMKTFSAEEISAKILIYLKNSAQDFLGQDVTDVVITVPAHFNDAQRKATIDAAEIAQLNVLGLINEPTAAALAYGVKNVERQRTLLFYDLGGGTFDVTIIRIGQTNFEVLATGGDSHLGGNDLTNLLYEDIAQWFNKKNHFDMTKNQQSVNRLITACEEAKITLSELCQTTVYVHALFDGKDLETEVSRARFEHLIDVFLSKTIDIVVQVMWDASLSKTDIDQILLVGGSTRTPKIEELLRKKFGIKIQKNLNPDEVVAQGAAIQASLLSKNCPKELKNIQLVDVASLSLGIAVRDTDMEVIVPCNTKLPVKRYKEFTTLRDNQTIIKFDVYEGEEPEVKNNHLLGSFKLENLPECPKGELIFRVCFDIKATGVLTVTATDKANKLTNCIAISYLEGRLSQKEIEEKIREIRIDNKCDIALQECSKNFYKLESSLKSAKGQALKLHEEKCLSTEEKNAIIDKCINFENWLTDNKNTTSVESLNDKMKKLQSDIPSVFSS